MDSNNKLILSAKEDQIKIVDMNLIKKEDEEEEYFVIPGIIESAKMDKISIKKEVEENEEVGNSSVLRCMKFLMYLKPILAVSPKATLLTFLALN